MANVILSRLWTPTVAILLGAGLVALVVAFTNRWQIIMVPGAVVRLDRWSGETVVCREPQPTPEEGGFALICDSRKPRPAPTASASTVHPFADAQAAANTAASDANVALAPAPAEPPVPASGPADEPPGQRQYEAMLARTDRATADAWRDQEGRRLLEGGQFTPADVDAYFGLKPQNGH